MFNKLGLAIVAIVCAGPFSVSADEPYVATRLFFQDHDSATLKWAQVQENEAGQLTLGKVETVPDFPVLDSSKQNLVQMGESKGRLLIGVRDKEDGQLGNGWVMLQTGVRYHDHGDHGHWLYSRPPVFLDKRIDTAQGNPAHLYIYDQFFYLANDANNGYTQFDPADWYLAGKKPITGQPLFIPGGGNHITLAVHQGKVGYGAWIDGGGPNAGRVDVTPVTQDGQPTIAYSFQLPTGVIHGATTAADKVFFAPADGICWVQADLAPKPDTKVKVNHIPLGKANDKPLRTGAFSTFGNWVFCVTGSGSDSQMVMIDASQSEPKPIFMPLNGKDGHKPLTPSIVSKDGKRPMAFIFHDREAGEEIDDLCDIVALDPEGKGDFSKGKIVATITVGPSKVSGHYGHHDVAFDADALTAYITNPGDGSIQAVSLKTFTEVARFKVGGMPTSIVAHGGREVED